MISLSDLSQHVEQTSPGDLPALIGKLEEAKARAWAKLQAPQAAVTLQRIVVADMLHIHEAAQRLGMSTSWLYRKAAQMPGATKIGGRWRFSPEGLEKYLCSRQRKN